MRWRSACASLASGCVLLPPSRTALRPCGFQAALHREPSPRTRAMSLATPVLARRGRVELMLHVEKTVEDTAATCAYASSDGVVSLS